MTVDSNVAQYLDILIDIGFFVLPTLALLAIVHPLGRAAADGFVRLWKWIRPQLDDPKDKLIVLLAEKSGKPPEQVIEELTHRIDAVSTILEDASKTLPVKPDAKKILHG
jgi:hypothetical protein